jgi:hypothetical protein
MNITAHSARARILGLFAAAGVSVLVGTITLAGSAGASVGVAGTAAPRITVVADATCSADGTPTALVVSYDDHVDGHVPQTIHEELRDGSTVVWTADGDLHQENGDYFNRRTFSSANPPFNPAGAYFYDVTITYDDGATQTQGAAIDVADECARSTPAPPSTVPAATDRFVLRTNDYDCGNSGTAAFVEWTLTEVPDGHYVTANSYDLLEDGQVVDHKGASGFGDPGLDSLSDSVRVPANFFDVVRLEAASYTLSVTNTYEDGQSDQHIETLNLADLCSGVVNGRTASAPSTTPTSLSTTTTVPGGTLPETGNSNLTWSIGAVAGLLTTAGAALFAGVRRSRND